MYHVVSVEVFRVAEPENLDIWKSVLLLQLCCYELAQASEPFTYFLLLDVGTHASITSLVTEPGKAP